MDISYFSPNLTDEESDLLLFTANIILSQLDTEHFTQAGSVRVLSTVRRLPEFRSWTSMTRLIETSNQRRVGSNHRIMI